jgi:uncharacterized protein (DUF2141 family)
MGYIFAFGTGFVAPIWGSALLLGLALSGPSSAQNSVSAPATDLGGVTLSVSNLRSAKGDVLICLTQNAKFFPDCGKDKAARKLKIPAAKAGSISFDDIQPGTYAIALIHDENANGKMDLALFLPKEGFGFSRNPAIGVGPPKFKSAQFQFDGAPMNFSVKMKYII